ncbi:hypothetical protein P170DRAFT_420442 [Aspergillus steynii IBT 23096]|uniref:Uncharacterized protein n=1 Tax=Aspergillus steynii IBT 23096 TaxID=1392250 RepID=A0A2I2GL41_9EURO|nr:uncharacterized protein P170DRAFT_420442 [Aspergillus steynii IBT 23096]PLB53604.1 hypothetical protein P170DRAFT_420442 [Aspergillus steynii IBT 23096]
MVSTATTTGPAASSTSCGSSAQYELPVKDAACGVPNTNKYKPLLEKCVQPAGVLAYNHDCAVYGLAVDQSVQDLTDCLYDAGVAWKDVWCYGDTNATATATSYPTATTTSSKTRTASSSSASSTETSAATSVHASKGPINLPSVVILSTLLASVALLSLQ